MNEPSPAPIRQCVILAGGMATRLGAHGAATPKPVLQIGDRPFLAWLLREFSRFGLDQALILTGHLSGSLRHEVHAFAARLPKPFEITFSEEHHRAGTGGALFHARHLLHDRFLLANGDSHFDCNLAPLLAASDDAVGHLLTRHVEHPGRCGTVETEGGRVTAFHPSVQTSGPTQINTGLAVYRRDIADHLRHTCSLEHDILPAVAPHLSAQQATGAFIDIGIPDDLARARAELPHRLHRPALILDRDGVINIDHGYVGTRDRFEFTPTARQAIARATNAGWHVFIATNQSGIARGHYDETAMHRLHAWLRSEVQKSGGTIDDIRHCPFHPEATVPAYAKVSDWRKPAPGMLLDLIRTWELNPARCLMIGDQPTDIAAATAAGIKGHLFPGGDLDAFVAPLLTAPPS